MNLLSLSGSTRHLASSIFTQSSSPAASAGSEVNFLPGALWIVDALQGNSIIEKENKFENNVPKGHRLSMNDCKN